MYKFFDKDRNDNYNTQPWGLSIKLYGLDLSTYIIEKLNYTWWIFRNQIGDENGKIIVLFC